MYDDYFIWPDNALPVIALYDLCWKTWFDSYDTDIQNPPSETKERD